MPKNSKKINKPIIIKKIIPFILVTFLFIQIVFPFRYFLYPGELFWNEQGYRFSWRVMLIEKRGETTFKVKDSITNNFFYVKNDDFLTAFQIKHMSFQPDFILEYAHYLVNTLKNRVIKTFKFLLTVLLLLMEDLVKGLLTQMSTFSQKKNHFIIKTGFYH